MHDLTYAQEARYAALALVLLAVWFGGWLVGFRSGHKAGQR